MATELQPGGNLRLPATTEIVVDVLWEPEKPGGKDVDASAFLLQTGGRVGTDDDFVFYNSPRSPCGGVALSEVAGAHRRLRIVPGALSTQVSKVAVCLTLYGGGPFAQASRIEVRVRDAAGVEVARFSPPTGGMQEAALILCEVYRHQDGWKFRAVAQGFAGGLGPLASHFGVDIGTDQPTTEVPPQPQPQSRACGNTASAAGAPPNRGETLRSAAAGLDYAILYRGAFALARVDLPQGQQIKAQSDAMVAMSPTLAVDSTTQGGLLSGLSRLVSGESFFLQTLTAARGAGSVYFAPAAPGDIAAVEVQPAEGLVIARGAFLACSQGVEVSSKMQNIAKGLFSGEGFFILKAIGQGLLFLESFGAIHTLRLGPGEQKIIDNGHLVAWSASMQYGLELGNPGLVAAFTSGENIVCRFHGPGTVLIQSRQPSQFGRWLSPLLPG
ncbi:TIGR00266 family protein [uncultured Thiodictyon sp.]|uniref:TIGR00266 family protein n=1 Tax=uncultured Thiodictyon sp. TaxID=1846217 RepID=UPI0025E460C4|nr:TIGR00266 family protein [uncultured Thiodictyon sp.]